MDGYEHFDGLWASWLRYVPCVLFSAGDKGVELVQTVLVSLGRGGEGEGEGGIEV